MSENFYGLHPQTYDEQFWWKKDDIEFWKNHFFNKNETILELASGTGRIGIPLVKENHNYSGLDISKTYCDYANKKLKDFTSDILFYNYDMKSFRFNKKFDNIFIAFNSLLHLYTTTDLSLCLSCIKNHMHEDSKFYIDIFVPSPLFLYREKDITVPILEFFNTIEKQITYVDEIIDYDKKNEIVKIKWLYKNDNSYYHEINFKMKMYYPDTMVKLLNESGFIIKNIWGDYDKNNFDEDSSKQIYECKVN